MSTANNKGAPMNDVELEIDFIRRLFGITDQDFNVQILALFNKEKANLQAALEAELPKKHIIEVEQPYLFQGVGGDSAPFYCSGCQMSEMNIMDRQEGNKYYCNCSYWTDPHNAYLDRSGGKWLGWKYKSAAQAYLDSLPTEENGFNSAIDKCKEAIAAVFNKGTDGGLVTPEEAQNV